MILFKTQPSVLPYFMARLSTLGVFSLILFVGLHLYAAANLVFFERSEVQQTLSFLSNNNLIFLLFDVFLVCLPLLALLARKAFLRPLSMQQGLGVLEQVAAALSLVAVIFHLYVTKMIFADGLGFYHYFGDLMMLMNTPFGIYIYGAFLVSVTLFLSREIWHFTVEWGFVVKRRAQVLLNRGLLFLGIMLAAFEIFIMIYQGQMG